MTDIEFTLRSCLLAIGAAIVAAAVVTKIHNPKLEVFPVLLLVAGMACIIAATDGVQ